MPKQQSWPRAAKAADVPSAQPHQAYSGTLPWPVHLSLVPAGHRLRYELEESWAADPLPHSDLGVKNVLQTEADMRSAVFCVCPPGMSLSIRLAWLSGCF